MEVPDYSGSMKLTHIPSVTYIRLSFCSGLLLPKIARPTFKIASFCNLFFLNPTKSGKILGEFPAIGV